MWYYKSLKTLTNIHKIFIFVILLQIQKKSQIVYDKYSIINKPAESNLENYYFLSYTKLCLSKNKSYCNCLILMEKFKMSDILKNLTYLKRIRIVDINFFGHLGMNMLVNIGYYDLLNIQEKKDIKKLSYSNLETLSSKLKNKLVYVLGNNEQHVEISKKINSEPLFICNDAIKNIKNLSSNTIIVSFSDPLFHFSNSEDSKDFIKLVKKFQDYIDYIIVPITAIPILQYINIKVNLIGLNSRNKINQNLYIENEEIFTKKTHNVLTQYMLPVAINFSSQVQLGAVTLSKNNYHNELWKYDKKLVPQNSKSFAFNYSFFKDRNFNKYYRLHQKQLNRILESNKNINIL